MSNFHPRARVLIAVLVLASAPVAHAARAPSTFYVSSTGSDAAPGTQARPWKTLGRANRQRFQAGDALLLEGGKTFAGSLVFAANSNGGAAAPIQVASYGSGRATIAAGTGDGIRVTNAGGYAIENLIVRGAGVKTNTGVGVYFHSTRRGSAKFDYALVRNVEVSGFLNAGVQFAAVDLYGFSNVTVDAVVAHDNGDSGISTFGRYVQFNEGAQPYAHANVHVTHSTVYRNLGIRGSNTNTGSGIELQSVGGGLIDYNIAHDNGGVGKKSVGGGPVAIWT